MFRPPLVAAGTSTTARAVARSGIRDHGSHSMWTSSPCSAARPHSPANASAACVDAPGAAEDVDGVERAGADGLGHGEEFVLAEAEHVLGVERRVDAHVGRSRQPPPGRVQLGHAQPVVVEHRPQVGVGAAPRPGPRR